jgi:formylglycine-generating enzyme required for sulfatase activity
MANHTSVTLKSILARSTLRSFGAVWGAWTVPLVVALSTTAVHASSIFDDDWTPPSRATVAKPATPQAPVSLPTTTPASKVPRPDSTSPTTAAPASPAALLGLLPVPAKADLARSGKLMTDVFAADLADHTIHGRRALGQKLLSEAAKYDASPVDKFVLLGGAIAAGNEGGDLRVCFDAADRLAAAFKVDAQGIKTDAALKMAPSAYASNPVENVKSGLEVLDQLVSGEDFSTAGRLATLLQPFASKDAALNRQVQQRIKDINAMRLARDRATAQMEKLKAAPYDPSANLDVGSYYWADPVLKDLAGSELARPPSADRLARLGDGWWDFATRQPGITHDHVCRHAASLYVQAYEGVSGLQRTLLEKRLSEAAAMEGRVSPRIWVSFTNTLGMKFVRIEPGEFVMGSPESEPGRDPNETQHKVKLTRAFMIATTLVTQEQWKSLVEHNPSGFSGADRPVEGVSWDDAVEFCKRLSAKEGKHYRLPTEAEWEYACRAGTTTMFYTGDKESDLADAGWYGKDKGNADKQTHPVAEKKPNAWGLYDMHGNVWEWCTDWFGEYPAGDATDPVGPSTGTERVLRGGSWFTSPRGARAASRGKRSRREKDIGFRVCLDP